MKKSLWLLTVATWAFTATASAQTASSDHPDANGQKDGLEDIVVTAQRRDENAQRVPITITNLSADQIASRGIANTEQLNVAVAGLNVRTAIGNFQPTIRGIGTANTGVENPVALYIDDVYYPSQRDGLRELGDVSNISVLKGPQGTLFGRNSTAGVIQITTKAPSHDFSGSIDTGLDNYATGRIGGYITGGLSDTVAASLSANYVTQGDGWGKNLKTGHDDFKINHIFSIRGKLLYEPGPSTKMVLIADYMSRSDSNGPNYQPYPGTLRSIPTPVSSNPYDTYAAIDSLSKLRSGGGSLSINQKLSFADLVSVTSYRRSKFSSIWDISAAPVRDTDADVNGVGNSFSQEIRLSSLDASSVKWTAGIFYFHNKNGLNPVTANIAAAAIQQVTNASELTHSIAPFAQLSYEFLPGTTFTLGGRYTYEKRTFDGRVDIFSRDILIPDAAPVQDAKLVVKRPTWRIGIEHQLNPDILLFASYNRGFKSGGFNVNSPKQPSYLPETLDAYEGGIKSELLGRRVRLNASAFLYDYRNIQVVQFQGITQLILNGASARLYGLDVDGEAKISSRFSLSANFELLHATFGTFLNAPGSIPIATGGAVITRIDASANRLPLSQKFTGTISAKYQVPLKYGSLMFDVTNSYNGGYYFESDNRLKQSDYDLLNASVRWTSPDENLSLSIWGRNLLDKKIISLAGTSARGYSVNYGLAPLIYGVSASLKF